jgi:hypothetical protein
MRKADFGTKGKAGRQKSDLVRKAPVVLRIPDVDSRDRVFELADGR